MNRKLDRIVSCGEKFLRDAGYQAAAQTVERVSVMTDGKEHRSKIPHKTVAVHAMSAQTPALPMP
jgi:hypothetical protein